MKFKVEKQIFVKFPDSKFGALIISGLDNSKSNDEVNSLRERVLKNILERINSIDINNLSQIYSWRWVFHQMLWNNDELVPAHEALLKRLKSQKTIPSINPLVDIYNMLSVKHMVPLGGHDTLDKATIRLGETAGGEIFKAMGEDKEEKAELSEIAYLSENKILTRHFVWRQSQFSMITNETKEVFIPIDDAAGTLSREKIQQIAEELIFLVNKYLGGEAKFTILDKYNSVVDFEDLEKYELTNRRNIEIEFIPNPPIVTGEEEINKVLDRGLSEILPSKEEFRKLLLSGKRISFYQGYDPSSSKLHIGNAIGMKILEKLRKLGHKIIFLIGTGTGKIGDPTDKNATRKTLSDSEITSNIEKWKEQASQVLNFDDPINPVLIVKNGDWLKPMTLDKFLSIGNLVTVQQLLEREMFQERLKAGKPISISEMLYPLLQGYDSAAMEVDGEFGGNDQLFNMMMGRTLEKLLLEKEKFVVTGKLLADPNGVKMGKSLGNVINLTDEPKDIFGKIMSFTDGMIISAFEILTEIPMEEVKKMEEEMKNGTNPIEFKKRLAFEVTKWIKGEEEAKKAQEHFENTVQNSEIPLDIPVLPIPNLKIQTPAAVTGSIPITMLDISGSEKKRIISQGGFELDGVRITNPGEDITDRLKDGSITKLGKRGWFKWKK